MTPILSQKSNRHGITVLLMVFLLIVLVGMVAFGVEVGRMAILRNEVQNAVDAGAIAASLQLTADPDDLPTAEARARDFIQRNRAGSAVEIPTDAIDVEIGEWDPLARSFTTAGSEPNAVRVFARQDNEPFFFAQVFGLSTFGAPASAVASGSSRMLDIMMVLDLSGSMRSRGRIEALQNSAPTFVEVIDQFGGNDQIGVMGYGCPLDRFDPKQHGSGTPYSETPSYLHGGNDPDEEWVAVMEGGLTNNFSNLTSSVLSSSNLKARKYGGGTPIGAGLRDASHYLVNGVAARDNVDRVIVLMSDGYANKPRNKGDSYALDMADYAVGEDITVHTISLGDSADLDLMQEIADRTEGRHFDATGSGEELLTERLTEAFRAIATTIKRSQLVE